ncbi:MAG TPA: hypothetical protein VHH36_06105 [Candidatus Thermoplasmatota archaeon]|nr:hypothetical protein [Candidatus Thermoplasmatota archaeon]
MAWGAFDVAQMLSAAFLLVLAGTLLVLNFEGRVHRAFALFLVLRGMSTALHRLALVDADAADAAYWRAMAGYFDLGLVPALLHFLLVYARPATRRPVATALLVAAAAAVEVAYGVDHCLDVCASEGGRQRLGPLGLLTFGVPLAYGACALILARAAASAPSGSRRAGASLVAFAFTLTAVLDAALAAGTWAAFGIGTDLAFYDASPWIVPAFLARILGILPALAAAVLLARAATTARGRRVGSVVLALVAATGVLVPFAIAALGLRAPALVLVGLWRLAMPAIVSYTLLRHGLFGLDVRLRWTIRRGTVAGAFVGVFLIAVQVAENFLDQELGLVLGGVAAGLLVLFLDPLQRAAGRLAHALLPETRPIERMGEEERRDLYRDQASLAWSDGALDRSERAMLDRLRERLGLGAEEAARIERDAAEGAPR